MARFLFFRKIILFVCGVLGACIVAEILLRLFAYQGLLMMRKDPVLGQIYKPNFRGDVYSEESGKFVPIEINSLGFRDRERSFAQGDSKRVVILGDSFAAAFSVEFEKIFPQMTEQYLNRHSAEEWEVINLGVAGFGTAQEMLAYQEYGRRFHPDVVVLCFFPGNDVSDNSSELSTNPRIYYALDANGRLIQEPLNRFRSGAASFLNEHSRFYVWQKTQMKKLERYYKYRMKLNPAYHAFLTRDDLKTERAWNITYALVRELAKGVHKDGAQFLAFYIPFPDAIYTEWWKETLQSSPPMQKQQWDLSRPERRLSSFCRRNGLSFLSPSEIFMVERSHDYYFRHGHFNEAGNARVAELLGDWILRSVARDRQVSGAASRAADQTSDPPQNTF